MSEELADLMAEEPELTDGCAFFADQRVVVQIAAAYEDNLDPIDSDPYISWVDVTEKVFQARWREGATNGAESRWPLGQLDLECYDLIDEIADFITFDPETRLAPGSLIRVGLLDTDAEVWYPQFSGIIDRIAEPAQAGPRVWRIRAYDVLYWLAGRYQDTVLEHFNDGDHELSVVLNAIFSNTSFPFIADGTFTARKSTALDITGNLVALMHRLADSYSCRAWAYRDGTVRVRPWDDIDRAWDDAAGGDGDGTIITDGDGDDETVHGEPYWSISNARVASYLHAQSSDDGGWESLTSSLLAAKNGKREDAPGWPKLDLLYDGADGSADLTDDAAARFGDELTLERIDIDTAHDQNQDRTDVIPLLRGWGAGDGLRFQRTRGTALDLDLLVLGAEKRIERFAEVPRMVASFHPKILGEHS